MSSAREIIAREDFLYRRFLPYHKKPDGKLSSSIYKDPKGKIDHEVSVDLARLTTPQEFLARGPGHFGVGVLSVAIPLDLGLHVEHNPRADDYAHCLILGSHTKETCRRMAEQTEIVIDPKLKND